VSGVVACQRRLGDDFGGCGGGGGAAGGRRQGDKKDKPKTTRVRTVLNEKQLHTLRTIYNSNPRPDALMKEQLVEMTGLSPRVIRVWFQNKRFASMCFFLALFSSRFHFQLQGQKAPNRHQANAAAARKGNCLSILMLCVFHKYLVLILMPNLRVNYLYEL